MQRRTLACLSMLAVVTSALAVPSAFAGPPFDEVEGIQWCVDTTSKQVKERIQGAANTVTQSWVGRLVTENYQMIKCKLHEHPPITIDGSDLRLKNRVRGEALADLGIVRGTGTAGDPYVIENWEIAGSDTLYAYGPNGLILGPTVDSMNRLAPAGIRFINTNGQLNLLHFVVNRVYVHGFAGVQVDVQGAPHVSVLNSILGLGGVGLRYAQTFTQNVVSGNTIYACQIGIDFQSSTSSWTFNNKVYTHPCGSGTLYGIKVTRSSNHDISNNNVDNWFSGGPRFGIWFSSDSFMSWAFNNRICAVTQVETNGVSDIQVGGTQTCDHNPLEGVLP